MRISFELSKVGPTDQVPVQLCLHLSGIKPGYLPTLGIKISFFRVSSTNFQDTKSMLQLGFQHTCVQCKGIVSLCSQDLRQITPQPNNGIHTIMIDFFCPQHRTLSCPINYRLFSLTLTFFFRVWDGYKSRCPLIADLLVM